MINIQTAKRSGARLVIGFDGTSGSGKTYSALQFAWGLAGGDASKVGLLDTENKRGRLYADILVDRKGDIHEFLIGDFDAPHSPQRYIDAIKAFQNAGVEVLVIDSISHEWEGIGGCEEIATIDPRTKEPLKFNRWNKAKMEHKRFMNALLQTDMHIVCCTRAREKVRIEKVNGETKYIPLGVQPICEKNFMFELTASVSLMRGGQERLVIKCPKSLEHIFGVAGELQQGYITARDGLAVKKWVDGAEPENKLEETARNKLRIVTEQGEQSLIDEFNKLSDDEKQALGGDIPQDIYSAAVAFDAQNKNEVDKINEELS